MCLLVICDVRYVHDTWYVCMLFGMWYEVCVYMIYCVYICDICCRLSLGYMCGVWCGVCVCGMRFV